MSQNISPLQQSLARLTGLNDVKPTNEKKDPTGLPTQAADAHGKAVGHQLPQDRFAPSAKGLQAASLSRQAEQAYGYSQTMSLSLTTKEGDKVQVDFRQLYTQYQSLKENQQAETGPQGARYFSSREEMEGTAFEEKFGFSVQGNLNDKELKAIYDVFDQVDQLATQFFDGNIEEAFKQAQNMDIDFGQLSNVSLDLQKTEVKTASYQQAAAYQGVAKSTAPENTPEQAKVSDLPPYLQKWMAVVDKMNEHFEQARQKVDELQASFIAQKEAAQDTPQKADFGVWYDRVKSFHDQLAEAAKLDTVTLKPSGIEVPLPPREETEQAVTSKATNPAQES